MGRWLVSWLPSDVYVHVRAAQPHVQEMQCNAMQCMCAASPISQRAGWQSYSQSRTRASIIVVCAHHPHPQTGWQPYHGITRGMTISKPSHLSLAPLPAAPQLGLLLQADQEPLDLLPQQSAPGRQQCQLPPAGVVAVAVSGQCPPPSQMW